MSIAILLVRTWLLERIRQSIRVEYDQRLEEYRRNLQTSHELMLQQIQAIQTTANNSLVEGQRVVAEYRVNAVKEVWQEVVLWRTELPFAIVILDPDEYPDIRSDPKLSGLTNDNYLTRILNNRIEEFRPFLGEYCFSLCFAYRAIVGRAALLLEQSVKMEG